MTNFIARLIISSLRSAATYVIPELVRYSAHKLIDRLKRKKEAKRLPVKQKD